MLLGPWLRRDGRDACISNHGFNFMHKFAGKYNAKWYVPLPFQFPLLLKRQFEVVDINMIFSAPSDFLFFFFFCLVDLNSRKRL